MIIGYCFIGYRRALIYIGRHAYGRGINDEQVIFDMVRFKFAEQNIAGRRASCNAFKGNAQVIQYTFYGSCRAAVAQYKRLVMPVLQQWFERVLKTVDIGIVPLQPEIMPFNANLTGESRHYRAFFRYANAIHCTCVAGVVLYPVEIFQYVYFMRNG